MFRKVLLGSLVCACAPMVWADVDADMMQPRQAVYYWASQSNVSNLLRMRQLGYSLDMMNEQGLTPACEAVYKNDVIAFKTLQQAGADMRSSCLFAVPLTIRQEFARNYQLDHSAIFTPTTTLMPVTPADVAVDAALAQDTSVAYKTGSVVESSSVFRPYVSLGFLYGKTSASLKATETNDSRSFDMSEATGGLSLAFGYRMNDVRLELEGRYNAEASDRIIDGEVSTKIQTSSLMFNAFYDIPTGIALRPYLMAGIGGAYNRGKIASYKNSEFDLAWQLGAGISYALTDNLSADLGYRYTNYGTVNLVNENNVEYKLEDIKAHNVTLGLRYEL